MKLSPFVYFMFCRFGALSTKIKVGRAAIWIWGLTVGLLIPTVSSANAASRREDLCEQDFCFYCCIGEDFSMKLSNLSQRLKIYPESWNPIFS